MKNIKLLGVLLVSCLATLGTTSCNATVGYGSFTFTKAHIQMPGMSVPTHLDVVSWKDDEGGVELKTKNFGTIIIGDGTYCLYDGDKCPICHNTPILF